MHDSDGTNPTHPSADDDQTGGAAAGADESRSRMPSGADMGEPGPSDGPSESAEDVHETDKPELAGNAPVSENSENTDLPDTHVDGGEGDDPYPYPDSGASAPSDADDAASSLEGGAFQDSGSFFRDRVARNLAEHYGLRVDENGRPLDDEDAPASDATAEADPDFSAVSTGATEDYAADTGADDIPDPVDLPGEDARPGTEPFSAVDADLESDMPRAWSESPDQGPDIGASTSVFSPPDRGADGTEPPFSYPGTPTRDPYDEPYGAADHPHASQSAGHSEQSGYSDYSNYPERPEAEPPSSFTTPMAYDAFGAPTSAPASGPFSSGIDMSDGAEKSGGVGDHDDVYSGGAETPAGDPFESHRAPAVPDFGDPTGAGATGTFSALSPGMTAGYGAGGEPPAAGPPGPPAIIPPDTGGPNGPSGPQEVAPHAAGGLQPSPGVTKKKSAAKKKKRPKKKRPLWFRLTRAGLISVFAVVLLGLGAFGAAYALIDVPDATQDGATDQGSTFYYQDGETEFLERGTDRQPVDLDDVPEHVQDAVLAAEDHGFWTEPGVSLRGTGRALWITLTSRFTGAEETQGGSTITQQMVRNYYEGLSQEQTIDRKLQEIVIALKVDQQQDKEWILEQYLNTIYMGRQAFGIQAAAQAYFDKDVSELTTEEAAYLAAAIQQPHTFGAVDEDNQENLGSLEGRWNAVMDHMVELGSMDEETLEADSVSEAEIPLAQSAHRDEELTGHTGYMWQQAMTELEALGYTEEDLDTGAYEIVTTFDEDMMTAAQESVEESVPVDNLPDGVRAGLTAVDPTTGEVLAFYGGPGYEVDNYDSAFRGSAQAGSAIKPYVLAAALEQGIGLNTVIDASSPQTFEGSSVQNAGGASYPRVNLVDATARSVNTGYIHLLQQAGQENVVDMMHEAGIPDDKITPEQELAPTLALGVSDVSPVDQASGFATFANGGEHIEPHVVRSIMDRDGEDQRPAPEQHQAMSEATASDVTYALERVITSGTGTRASIGRPAAGKTGTTDSSVAAWFVGYTPQLSGAVGIYNGDNQPFSMPGYGSLSGGTMPADVWRTFMSRALEGQEAESFSGPSGQGSTHDWGGAEPEPSPAEDERDGDEEPEPEPEEPQEDPPAEEEPEDELEDMPEPPGDVPDSPEAFAHQNAPTTREQD